MTAATESFRNYRWMPHVLSIELRKLFAYRAAFWIRFALGALTDIAVAYFLWGAIFRESGASEMKGYSFHGIVYYSAFATLCSKLIRPGIEGDISRDIYEGGLTRYLVYPLSFLQYSYLQCFAHQLVGIVQLCLGYFVLRLFWEHPEEMNITASHFVLGIGTALFAGALIFTITACLELVAFWQDTVWNLMAMLRFIGNLLGGVMIPIAFFPEWGQRIVAFTPFPLIYSFPIRCFLGQVSAEEWSRSFVLLLAWILIATGALVWIWRRGTLRYSGVGI